jgi:Protein of unknown function (DUF3618)
MTETTTHPDRQRMPNDPSALQADIDDARERLGETVDEMGSRLDVRARLNGVAQRISAAARDRSGMLGGAGLAAVAVAGIAILAWRRRRG